MASSKHRFSLVRKAMVTVTFGAFLLIPAACNIVAPVLLVVEGPPSSDPVHRLDRDRPTVVFVDDLNNILPRQALKRLMAEEAQKYLMKERAILNVIDSGSAYMAAQGDKSGKLASVVELGKAVGAEIVVYVTVEAFSLTPDGSSYEPSCSMFAKVLDVTKPKPRLWPEEKEGFPFTARFVQKTASIPTSSTERARAEDNLARQAGKGIGQLFTRHELSNSAFRGK